jgi:anti-sigma regulatory factor (Ser/Thr protein kinase)
VLHVGTLTPRVFTEDDRELLQLAGDRAAPAIENARLFEQRRVAEILQQRLLPTEIPAIAGLEVASRYLPAAGSSLGGDWYDVFELPDGRVVLAVGDVVGHGVEAAATMAQLRSALRAYAAVGYPPSGVVESVARLVEQLGPRTMATLAYVLLDPADEQFEIVSAAHPPAVLVEPDSEPRFVETQPGVPLGTVQAATYTSETVAFPAGSTLVLYTDGLVERRDEPLDTGLDHLRRIAAGATDVEKLCTEALERLLTSEPEDDVALIAVHMPPLAADLRTSWPASPAALASVRRLLRRWLRMHGASEDEAYDILVACQEACANAVEHAYGPGQAHFDVEAEQDGAQIRIVVRDRGRWRAPRGEHRGRGLPLMRSLMESVEVEHTDTGTVVMLSRTLGARTTAA